MGRPRQANAKTVVVGVRLTQQEAADLDKMRHGMSRSAFIGAQVRKVIKPTQPRSIIEPPMAHTPARVIQVEPLPTEIEPAASHWHDRKGEEDTRMVKGSTQRRNRCSQCGEWQGWR